MASQNGHQDGHDYTIEDVAMGFIKVANEAMCRPIRALTEVNTLQNCTDVKNIIFTLHNLLIVRVFLSEHHSTS